MGFLRLVAWLLVAIALMLLGADIMTWAETGAIEIRTTAEVMNLLGLGVAANIGDGPVAGVGNFFLNAPLWALIGGAGIILTLIFRPLD